MDLNLKNIKKILLIITFSVLIYVSLQHVKEVVNGVQRVFKLLYPIILGFAIAFVLNVFMKIFETQIGKFFKKSKNTKLKKLVRPLAILVTLAFAVGVLLIVGLVVIPELIILAETLGAVLPVYIENVYLWVEDIFLKFNIDVNFLDSLQINWDAAFKNLIDSFLKSSSIFLGTATTAVSAVFSFIANFTIGIVLAIYVLFHKEKVCAFSKGLSKATFPKKVHSEILRITSLTSDIFSKFIVGQLTEAVILGSLCFVGMLIFRFPHAMVISIFTMITALIPIIGAFLGGAVGFVLILMVRSEERRVGKEC